MLEGLGHRQLALFSHIQSHLLLLLIFRIFACINKVFVNQLCTWLLYGELKDPYQEFFIVSQGNDNSETFLMSPSTTTCDKSLVSTVSIALFNNIF